MPDTKDSLVAAMVKGYIIHNLVDLMTPAREAEQIAARVWELYNSGGQLTGYYSAAQMMKLEYDATAMLGGLERYGYVVAPTGDTQSRLYICVAHQHLGVSRRTTCPDCEAKYQEWKGIALARRAAEAAQENINGNQ